MTEPYSESITEGNAPSVYRFKELLHILLVVTIVCLLMPYVKIESGESVYFFSIYDLATAFYKSEIGLKFYFTAKSLSIAIKVMAWVCILSTFYTAFMSCNPNRAKAGDDHSLPILLGGLFSVGLFFGLYYYLGYVVRHNGTPDAVCSFSTGGVVYLIAMFIVILLMLLRRVKKRTTVATLLVFLLIPATIFFGVYFLGDRKYFAISLLVILEIMLPFFVLFENRKPEAREMMVIAVLAGLAAAGRAAFFMLPHFKPVLAMVIISGVCLGPEAGFLVGALAEFVSNFLFGQGPWTPWQMFAFGISGFLAGLLFKKGWLKKKKLPICIFGAVMAICFCGIILDTSTIFTTAFKGATPAMLIYLSGLPVNTVHAVATVFFLWFLFTPMSEKIDRIKKKYGIMEP